MKRFSAPLFALLSISVLTLIAFAQPETTEPSDVTFWMRLEASGRFFGMFLLVMGAIFAMLFLTKYISKWIDNRKK